MIKKLRVSLNNPTHNKYIPMGRLLWSWTRNILMARAKSFALEL